MFPSVKLLPLITGLRTKLEKVHQEADRILEKIINKHRKSVPRTKTSKGEAAEDLVDVLLKIQEHGNLEFPFTVDNIKAVIWPGHFQFRDRGTICACRVGNVRNAEKSRSDEKAHAEVRQVFDGKGSVDETSLHELKYLKSVIKETQRLHPATPFIIRECRDRCEINGYEIPGKTIVFVNLWAIGRDPAYWSDPERFYPERFSDNSLDYKGTDFEYIPFGSGRRMCAGMSLALANIELPLAQFLYHFDWKLPDGMNEKDLDMTETYGLVTKRKNDLYLTPILYHPDPLPIK